MSGAEYVPHLLVPLSDNLARLRREQPEAVLAASQLGEHVRRLSFNPANTEPRNQLNNMLDTVRSAWKRADIDTSLAAFKQAQQVRKLLSRYRKDHSAAQLLADTAEYFEHHIESRREGDAAGFSRVYIPVLRSLRTADRNWEVRDPFDDLLRDQYRFPNLPDRPKGYPRKQSYCLRTGQDFNARIRAQLLGRLTDREMIADFQRFLGDHFFGGQAVTFLPKGPDVEPQAAQHTLHIKIGNERERPIYELGDGITNLIILLYPLFDYRDTDLLLFIEEPENHLHPGFQRAFIDAVLTLSCDGDGSRQVFVATHSNQFLDLTLDSDDVSVFRVSKSLTGDGPEREPKVTLTPRSHASRPLLRELGVRNASVLLTNCSVWVEGVTDRMYIRHYLSLLWQHEADEAKRRAETTASIAVPKPPPAMMEDIHFTIAEYGGANIDHWNFTDEQDEGSIWLKRMIGEAMLIMDGDDTKENPLGAKAKRAETLKAKLGEAAFHLLPVREIENLVSATVLKLVVESRGRLLANVPLRDFEESQYHDSYLGRFIHEQVLPDGDKPTRQYRSESGSGTIDNKSTFAKEVIDQTKAWSDLSPEAQELARKVAAFIRSHNQ